MLTRPTNHLPLIVTLGLLGGCADAASDTPPGSDARAVSGTDCTQNCKSADTGGAGQSNTDSMTDWPEPDEPIYEIGFNPQGETASSFFQIAEEGAMAPVVLGAQGAWMVVFAGRTNQFGCCVERVDVEATVQTPGDEGKIFGKLRYKRRPLFDGGDNFLYLMNIFMVVGAPDDWKDQEAELTLAITPHGGGETLTNTVRVTLVQEGTAAE